MWSLRSKKLVKKTKNLQTKGFLHYFVSSWLTKNEGRFII
jgi:hypothetical protein